MRRAALLALWSHWRRHPLQLATLLAGLALATALWSAVQAINAEARASYARAAAQIGAGGLDRLEAPGGPIPLARYVALRRAGWQLSPVLEGSWRLGERRLRVAGIEPLSHPPLPAFAALAEDATALPQMIAAGGLLLAAPDLAADLATALHEMPGRPQVRASDQVPPGLVLTDIGVAARLLGRPDQIDRMLILPDQPIGLAPLSALAPDLQRLPGRAGSDTARLTDSFHLNLTAFGLLSFAVGLFIVHGTVGLAFEQRRAMIRTLRALGLPMRLLTGLMLAEVMALALLGGLVGLGLGYLVAAALLPDVAATLRGLYGAPVAGGLTLRPAWIGSGLAMALAGTLAASLHALWRAARMPILAAPGLQAWAERAARASRLQALAGLGLIAAGLGALWLIEGLIGGFALLAGLMLGAALLLPPALAALLRLGRRRARGVVAEWLWADMRAQLPGIGLALMALLLALATNIGVGTMVKSFRQTFTGWLDQRLISELYVTATDDDQGAEIARWLAPRVQAVLPIRSVDFTPGGAAAGQTVTVYGVVDDRSYRDHWPLLQTAPRAWDRVMAGEAVFINEQLARRVGIGPGDSLTLAPNWQLPIAGVYSDYGNPTGQAIVAMPSLLAHASAVPNRRFGLRLPAAEVPVLAEALRQRFDLPASALIDNAALKAQSLAIFDKTFVVTGALNLLTLGVAGFAILTSLLTLWSLRLPQIAPVWALGLTRSQLARLEIGRSLLLAALTALLALPLGLLLAWALLAVINVQAFGWQLPMALFPLDWLRLFALALLAAGLAAALPARRLYRLPPSDLLKVFANAR
ncbi:FtsX-like permease family protein [Pseudodonghicola flavimaris]|uniref:FtsX-like permease family protein n=1 Tax=Pseudodonghicola flavimaris TaxID=3050036 RepID=A0ABT7F153_9RHOB|nr:FtsX-like permease family protein [Pseudodonghicola flavimaris]MDK3018319.1 FtsX-like permease family protein [Pseudodonghicola flavimaris]